MDVRRSWVTDSITKTLIGKNAEGSQNRLGGKTLWDVVLGLYCLGLYYCEEMPQPRQLL